MGSLAPKIGLITHCPLCPKVALFPYDLDLELAHFAKVLDSSPTHRFNVKLATYQHIGNADVFCSSPCSHPVLAS